MLRGRVQQALGRVGYQLQRTPAEGSLDRDLQRVIADRDISVVLDIGAHVGHYAARLRELGYTGRIVSFEPSPRPFHQLRASADWEVQQVAVGDRDGVAELHVYAEHEEFTSLRRPSEYGRAHYGLTEVERVSVPVRRLDGLVDHLQVNPARTFVKIDTQGHDVAVMDGGTAVLSRAAALQVEVPMFGLYEGAPAGTAVVQRILDMGFDLVGMYPVHAHPRPLVPVVFDGLFARGAAAG